MNPLWNLVLVLLLAAAIKWLVPWLPASLASRFLDVLELSLFLLLLGIPVTIAGSAAARSVRSRTERTCSSCGELLPKESVVCGTVLDVRGRIPIHYWKSETHGEAQQPKQVG